MGGLKGILCLINLLFLASCQDYSEYRADDAGRTFIKPVDFGFHRVPPPTDAEMTRAAARIRSRVVKLLERRDLRPQADPQEADTLGHAHGYSKIRIRRQIEPFRHNETRQSLSAHGIH